MGKKDLIWAIIIIVLLVLVFVVSGVFYFNMLLGGIGAGHVVLDLADGVNGTGQKNFPVVGGDVIFREIEDVDG